MFEYKINILRIKHIKKETLHNYKLYVIYFINIDSSYRQILIINSKLICSGYYVVKSTIT